MRTMRRFLLCAGVQGMPRSLDWLAAAVKRLEPEGVLFAGGVLDGIRQFTPHGHKSESYTHDEARFLEKFFVTVSNLGVYTAVIPGPQDWPLEDFLRLAMNHEVESAHLHVVHATLFENADMAVIGLGGELSEKTPDNRDSSSRTMAEYYLRAIGYSDKPHKVVLLGSSLGGPFGCRLVGELIDSLHPSLCVVGGTNEERGYTRLANTLVINPGWLADGAAAWLDWSKTNGSQVDILDLRHPENIGLPVDIGVCD